MIDKKELKNIMESLPSDVRLVAVSKFKPNQDILDAYGLGIMDFGENRPQELKKKMEELPTDIRWHFIGHLQTNKIKMIIDNVHLIHSVDSEKLLDSINKEAKKRSRVVDCLLQVYIATEESKQGLTNQEVLKLVQQRESYGNVRICGLMGMASFSEEKEKVSGEFASLKKLFDKVRMENPEMASYFKELSMGMSGDYPLAIEQGSTIVRIGSLIFGDRNSFTIL